MKASYNCRSKNDDYYHKGREGGGQRAMIEIIISENDDNDGWPLKYNGLDHFGQCAYTSKNTQFLMA